MEYSTVCRLGLQGMSFDRKQFAFKKRSIPLRMQRKVTMRFTVRWLPKFQKQRSRRELIPCLRRLATLLYSCVSYCNCRHKNTLYSLYETTNVFSRLYSYKEILPHTHIGLLGVQQFLLDDRDLSHLSSKLPITPLNPIRFIA